MNIAGIYAFNDPTTWCTPNAILNEFEARGHSVHRVSLFDHKSRYDASNLIDFVHSQDLYEPDIILFFDYGRFDSDWLDKKHFPNSFFVGEMGDEGQNFENNFPKSHKFDLIHTPDHSCYLKYKEAGRNVIWLPHFADTRIVSNYCTGDGMGGSTAANQPVRSTRGPGSSYIMDSLSIIMPDRFINRNGLTGYEHSKFLSMASLVLQQSRWHEITRRLFEAASNGVAVLTDRLSVSTNIDSIFTEGKDILYYDNLSDCVSKINYYLSPEGLLKLGQIGSDAQHNVFYNHTQVQRVDSILNQYNIWKTYIK